jgi:mRNA-degrading endonuclease RelE of RelBE toxin-antitoxin system
MAHVTYDADAAQQLQSLPASIQGRLARIVLRLQQWPNVSGAKPLRGKLAGRFRIRTGDYRAQFRIEGEEVVIERVGHRDGFYGE